MAKPKNTTPVPSPAAPPAIPPVPPAPQVVARVIEPEFGVEAQPMRDFGKGWYILLIDIYGKPQQGDVFTFGMTSTYTLRYRLRPNAHPVLNHVYDINLGPSGVARVDVYVPPTEKRYEAQIHFRLSCRDRILAEYRRNEFSLESADPQRGTVEPGAGVLAHFLRHMR